MTTVKIQAIRPPRFVADSQQSREFQVWMNQITDAMNLLTGAVGIDANHLTNFNNPHQTTAAQVHADPAGTGASEATSRVASHEAKPNPHPQYATDGDVSNEAAQRLAADNLEAGNRIAGDSANTAALSNHEADTSTHGVELIVGADEAQTLSNKTLGSTNKYGGASDYTQFEADGTMVAHGDATTWRDELGDITRIQVSGIGISVDGAENTMDFSTTANLSDYVYANYQINHDWKSGTAANIHIHFLQTNNAVPNFLIEHRWQKNGAAKTTAWTRAICTTLAFTYTAGTLNQIAYLSGGIAAPVGYGISDILQIRIYRDNANTSGLFPGADAYTGDAEVTSADIHLECDTLGSRSEYAK